MTVGRRFTVHLRDPASKQGRHVGRGAMIQETVANGLRVGRQPEPLTTSVDEHCDGSDIEDDNDCRQRRLSDETSNGLYDVDDETSDHSRSTLSLAADISVSVLSRVMLSFDTSMEEYTVDALKIPQTKVRTFCSKEVFISLKYINYWQKEAFERALGHFYGRDAVNFVFGFYRNFD